MTDSLEALEALVEKWRKRAGKSEWYRFLNDAADELEPIIQQVERVTKERDVAWESIESLRAERERYRELAESVQHDYQPSLSRGRRTMKALAALQASSPKEEDRGPDPQPVDAELMRLMDPQFYGNPPTTGAVAKDSDIPEKCPTCGKTREQLNYGMSENLILKLCRDPFHTQVSADIPEKDA